jgi:small subunit ribosomal protein S18
MAMEQAPARKKTFGKGKGKGKFGDKKPREGGFGGNSRYQPKLLGKAYFQRKKGCPFSGPKAPKIDYKDVRTLQRYLSDYGKMLPRHLTGVCAAKQRELATAIKRARMLALLPFAATTSERDERRAERNAERGPRREGGFNRDRAPRETAAPATPAAE